MKALSFTSGAFASLQWEKGKREKQQDLIDQMKSFPRAGPAQVLPAEPKSTLEHDIDRYISVLAKYQFIRNDKALHPSLRRVAGQPDICVTSP